MGMLVNTSACKSLYSIVSGCNALKLTDRVRYGSSRTGRGPNLAVRIESALRVRGCPEVENCHHAYCLCYYKAYLL